MENDNDYWRDSSDIHGCNQAGGADGGQPRGRGHDDARSRQARTKGKAVILVSEVMKPLAH